ncbi:MAG: hypothetical protein JSR78_16890 [Proteobacteria bacterium]|nr:hypothetical protein [Pseudomonadota bacterium]
MKSLRTFLYQAQLEVPMMLKRVLGLLAISAIQALTIPGAAIAEEQISTLVKGKRLAVRNGSPPVLVLGKKVILRPSDDIAYLNIHGAYEGVGRTFVLVSESTGGNGCPVMFAIVEMQGKNVSVSEQFGTCNDVAKAEAKDDALIVTIPKFDGTGDETTTFRNGQLTKTETIDSEDGEGPERAPGGDLALFVSNKHISEAMGMKAFVNALKKIMPQADFKEARGMALSGPGIDFWMHDGAALANACERHNCGDHSFSVAVDQSGRAWAALYNDGKARFFGDPDQTKKQFLDPSFRPQ